MKDKIQEDKQPFENFEELPCDVIDKESFEKEIEDNNHHLAIEVQTFVGVELGEVFDKAIDKLRNAYVARTTKRGTRFYAGEIDYDSKTGIVTFFAGTSIPDYIVDIYKKFQGENSKDRVGTTFADFCFLTSDGTTFHTKDQCATPFKEGVTPADLTWLLPAKFVDDMVEMMSIMNNLILCGMMQESILYGPILN